MAKQLITQNVNYLPSTNQIDFSTIPGFDIGLLYAVVNITRNVPVYAPGVPGYGISSQQSPSLVTLQYNISSHNSTDSLNIYYDVSAGTPSAISPSSAAETGGNLEEINKMLELILVELKVHSSLMHAGFHGAAPLQGTGPTDELVQLRNDIINIQNYISNH